MANGEGCKCGAWSSIECACPEVDWTDQETIDLRAMVVTFTKALEFYADEGNYKKVRMLENITSPFAHVKSFPSRIAKDKGQTARDALNNLTTKGD